jgi:4-hydroxy-tetrahydrodipicolinate reductase
MKTLIGINGAAGRMGQRLVCLAREDGELTLAAALEHPGHPAQGRDVGEVCPTAVARRIPLVVATTGLSPAQRQEVEAAAHETAVLMSPNMSLAVNVLYELVRQAARLVNGKGFDVEIIERHHRFKKDSPSGTALLCARVVQEEMGQTLLRHGREGVVGERPSHEIGIHAVRVGDNVGEHTVIFSTLGETLEVAHKGHTRDSYARGALLAAKFLAGKPAGSYSMKDVLGL